MSIPLRGWERHPSPRFPHASTEGTLKADFENIIRSRGSEYRSSSHHDALALIAKNCGMVPHLSAGPETLATKWVAVVTGGEGERGLTRRMGRQVVT